MRAGVAGAVVALLAGGTRAEPFSTRTGTSGVFDVPDANTLGLGALAFDAELRLDRAPGKPQMLGPSPLSAGLGLGSGLEAGLALREGGLPGDPRPSPLLLTGALKQRFVEQAGALPAMGVQLSLDRINWSAHGALDLLVTADLGTRVRASVLIGAEQIHGLSSGALGRRTGGSLTVTGLFGVGLALEALDGPGGALLGGGLRWLLSSESAVTLGAQWEPRNRGLSVSLGFAFSSAPLRRLRIPVEEPTTPLESPKPAPTPPGVRVFRDPVPRLRLKIKGQPMPGEDANRHLQYGPPGGAAPIAPQRAPEAPSPKGEPAGTKENGDEARR